MKTYVSDLEDFKKPERIRGRVVIVNAGCGSGKSYAALSLAQNHDFMRGGKMLYLTTRTADYEKMKTKIKKFNIDNTVIRTMQSIEREDELGDIDISRFLFLFDCVIVDEAHYWINDHFNESAVLSYRAVKRYADMIAGGNKNFTLILISATPENLGILFNAREIKGPKETTHIKGITFIPTADYTDQAVREILKARNNGKKCIIFFSKKREIKKCKSLLAKNGAADSIEIFTAKRDRPKPDSEGNFAISEGKTAILATSVLAFGVDYWDPDIDVVMTNSCDPILAIQELGRKRCNEDAADTVYYYIADFSSEYLQVVYQKFINKMEEADAFFADPVRFDNAHAEGGRWREGWEKKNHCIHFSRHTHKIEINEAYHSFCERLKGYSKDLAVAKTTWRRMILFKIGFEKITDAPVINFERIIRHDVLTEIEKIEKIEYPTTSDYARIGVALRIRNHGMGEDGKDYKWGGFISRPSALNKHLEMYGYRVGERKRHRENGTIISYYPLERIS